MKIFKRFLTDKKASALLEFALAAPIFITILFGVIEVSNYVYTTQKAQSAADNIANIINLQDNASTEQLSKIADMLPQIVVPLSIGASDYRVVITAMQRDVGGEISYIRWQKAFGGMAGASAFIYRDGLPPQDNQVTSDQLDGFVFSQGDQILVAEVWMRYRAIVSESMMNTLLGLENSALYYRTPPARPRMGSFQFHPDDVI